ncbi:Uncharacterised protein [Mycobacterium tuberculosis]|nr:Uncharacterised protein [Mycobacterium tuberculosis]CNV33677.1 Uncharacterised protein [Mycobacterium tuberculosis]CNW38303.1 Uncharacterised protein [Mycobacterium tuberculosis]CNW38528.1 Uncharacterised protein [Mycobacterium tuberculosis]COU66251.1 Uncharacterised protein [Mycobacterium tuberculosis]
MASWCRCRPGPARFWSRSTWCSRYCTARTARTARSRDCSNSPGCPTWAPVCWPVPSAWTRSSPRSCSPPMDFRWVRTRCCVRRGRHCTARSANGWAYRCSSNPPEAARRSVLAGCRVGINCPPRSRGPAGMTLRSSSRPRSAAASWNAVCSKCRTAHWKPARWGRSGWPGCGDARTLSTTSQPSISTTQPNWTCPPRSMTRSQRRFVSWRSGRSRLSTAGVWPGWTSSSPTTVR